MSEHASPSPARVERALRTWLEEVRFASYDPYDGLSCAWPWSIVRRQRLLARVWTQLIKTSPVNLRPLVGIRPRVLVKSLADLAAAAVLRERAGLEANGLDDARRFLRWLRVEIRPGYSGACWALATPYVTRFIQSEANEPNLFWTINVANAFLDAYETDAHAEDLATARSAIDFVLSDLGVIDEGDDGVWFRYFVGHDAIVYNVAALMGALLIRVASHTREDELATLGTRAVRGVVRQQNANGSWYYARGAEGRWVDGFHTGYVLESLLQVHSLQPEDEVESALRSGLRFYRDTMFSPDATPRYTERSLYPIEVQNCAQAIQTLARASVYDPSLLEVARAVTRKVIELLFRFERPGDDERGYFICSRGRWFSNRLPMVRWGEAPMLLALTHLLASERRAASRPPTR